MGGAGMAPRPARGAVAAARAAAAPAPTTGPSVSAPLDRSVAFEDFTTDINIVVKGRVIAVLRRSAGFPSGRLPGDRAQWVPDSTGGSRMCYALSSIAAARCLAAGGWR
jgi:hypothetical protein